MNTRKLTRKKINPNRICWGCGKTLVSEGYNAEYCKRCRTIKDTINSAFKNKLNSFKTEFKDYHIKLRINIRKRNPY